MIYGVAALFAVAVFIALVWRVSQVNAPRPVTYRMANESIDGSARRPMPVALPRASNGVAVPAISQPDPSSNDAALLFVLLAESNPNPYVAAAEALSHVDHSPSFDSSPSHDHSSSSFDHGSSGGFDGGSSGGFGD